MRLLLRLLLPANRIAQEGKLAEKALGDGRRLVRLGYLALAVEALGFQIGVSQPAMSAGFTFLR